MQLNTFPKTELNSWVRIPWLFVSLKCYFLGLLRPTLLADPRTISILDAALFFVSKPKKSWMDKKWQCHFSFIVFSLARKSCVVSAERTIGKKLSPERLNWISCTSRSASAWPIKSYQMSIKVTQKWFHKKNYRFWHLHKKCLRMREIWVNKLLQKALKSCPKSNNRPIWSHCSPSSIYHT